MKFTYKWLTKFLTTDLNPEEIGKALTKLGIECSEIIDRKSDLSAFKVAEILDTKQHPNADKLRVCTVFDGTKNLQIVCGALNARSGIKVVLAPIGAIIPNGGFTIKASEIRSVASEGMLCSADELNISNVGFNDGIIELEGEAEAGEQIFKYLGLDDAVFEVEITPNRGDLFGVYGIARDLAAANYGTLIEQEDVQITSTSETSVLAEISTNGAKLLAIREITNLNNCESPAWLKNILSLSGITPISAIVDITNYFAISFARPLHAYDRDLIGTRLIAKSLESPLSFLALNGKTYELSAPDLIISDENNVLALAGIMGGETSKCSLDTKNIVLESAVFDKVAVTKLGRKHNIFSDSRTRFERGIDHDATIYYLDLATKMILDICGGQASKVHIAGSKTEERKKIIFDSKIIEKRIGLNLTQNEIEQILTALGITSSPHDDNLKTIPSWRHDIDIPEILAEEVARIYGYDRLETQELDTKLSFRRILSPAQKRSEELRRLAASIGYNELITWSFMPSKIAKEFASIDEKLLIENPISSELDYMRPSIIPNLLSAAQKNLNRSEENLAFFELGPIFTSNKPEGEHNVLSCILIGEKEPKDHSTDRPILYDFFDAKAHLGLFCRDIGINLEKLIVSSDAPAYYHPGRNASFKLGKSTIAYCGEIHPSILEIFEIKKRILAIELFLNEAPIRGAKFGKKQKIIFSPYQKIFRDFAFLLNEDVCAGDIMRHISSIDPLVKHVRIFDLYKGQHLPEHKKSLAIRLTIQSDRKTLSDDEIEELSNKVIESIAKKFGAELRG